MLRRRQRRAPRGRAYARRLDPVARARPPVSMLPTPAQLFGVSVDELSGLHKNGAGKRGPASLLQKQIERLNRLPKAQKKIAMQVLDGVLSQTNR